MHARTHIVAHALWQWSARSLGDPASSYGVSGGSWGGSQRKDERTESVSSASEIEETEDDAATKVAKWLLSGIKHFDLLRFFCPNLLRVGGT